MFKAAGTSSHVVSARKDFYSAQAQDTVGFTVWVSCGFHRSIEQIPKSLKATRA